MDVSLINSDNYLDSKTFKKMANAAFLLAGVSLTLAIIITGTNAKAQSRAAYANEFSRPYGLNTGDEITPYDAKTRDLNGNRSVIDGVIIVGDDLSKLPLGIYATGSSYNYSGTSSATAIGNQLNVSTTGSYNTVVVNSNQTNNGNQTVIIQNGTNNTISSSSSSNILNGGLSF